MSQRKNKSIAAAVAFTALLLALAAGCYYDRDDDWGYHRYSERRYSIVMTGTAIGATVEITTGVMIAPTIVSITGTTPAHLAIAIIATLMIEHA